MEVRMQPRTDFRQRCLSFYAGCDAAGDHDDVPRFLRQCRAPFRHSGEARADRSDGTGDCGRAAGARIVSASDAGDWSDLDARVAQTDYWEMLLPSQYAAPTELLNKLGGASWNCSGAGNRWRCCRN